MKEPYRLTVRGIDPELIKYMRIIGLHIGETEAQILNKLIREFVISHAHYVPEFHP